MTVEDDIKYGLDFYNISYDETIIKDIAFYLYELKKWNNLVNLTGYKEIRSMTRGLLYDAFFVYNQIRGDKSVLDMGSGSGILSVPSAILDRGMDIFSVDKNMKKINFQNHIKRLLKLTRFYPIKSRIESLKGIEVDSIVVKGFGKIEAILDKGGRLVKNGGRILILKGKNELPIDYDGFMLCADTLYVLPGSQKKYRLFIYKASNKEKMDDL